MIIKNKKLFFHTASIILEDKKILELLESKKYSSIIALSYNKLDLPKFVSYSKPTLLVDLTKPEDKIFHSFNDTTRNEIRRTEKIEEFTINNHKPVDKSSYLLYKRFEYSQGRVPVPFTSLAQSVFFGAYYNNQLISGIYVIESYPYLRIRSIFSKRLNADDKELYKIIGYATRRIVWEICLWGKKNGYLSLDMASVNINNPKTESIARFKMSFGKDLIPEYTYIYKTRTFTFFEKMVIVKILLKKIIHKFLL